MQIILLVIEPHLVVFMVFWNAIPTLTLDSPRVIISNHELIHLSIVVDGNTSKCSPWRTPSGSPSLPPKFVKPRGRRKVHQCLPGSFPGANSE